MVTPDRSVGVVFNGAIYNYRELRKDLIAQGHVFRSNTDTEVLVHGYQAWGLDQLVTKLQGMFAFGLWDNRTRTLYLVRDRLGVKPLVFAVCDKVIAFASTVRALRAAGFVNDYDENAVLDFLELGFVSEARSIYRGALKVPAASILEWSNGALRQHEYWRPPCPAVLQTRSFHDAVEETEHLLLRAVEARLHADVPVGALLSGGIDSSLICWAITKLGGDVTAYTIGTPGDTSDETAAARVTARQLGIKHRVLEMSAGNALEIEELASAYAEPFACASALGMLKVSRAVSSSAKVLLTGDGGDDVFLGYPHHRYLWLASKLSSMVPPVAQRSWLACRAAFPRYGPLRRAAALFDYTTGGLGAFLAYSNDLTMYADKGVLGERLLSLLHHRPQVSCTIESGQRVLADCLDYERRSQFVGEYMTKVDGATMYYGLEARSPFLDQRLWEFASSLPFDVRLHRGCLKAILRALVHRRIGSNVAIRRKQGFGVPVQSWIIGHWRPQVEALLCAPVLEKEAWIRPGTAHALLQMALHEGRTPLQLWYLLVLELWMRYEQITMG
jgi:asparagine synthase (glutamine-hydrolysing)